MSDLSTLEQRALAELNACGDEDDLSAWNTRYFGKQGEVALAVKKVGTIPPAERRAYGLEANRVKEALAAAYEKKKAELKEQSLAQSLAADALDVTLPGRPVTRGRLHIATQILREIYAAFAAMGFQIYRSREVEDDRTNFELLNMPEHHPARDM